MSAQRSRLGSSILAVIFGIISLVTIAPLVWIAISGARPSAEVLGTLGEPSWGTFVPESITGDNFAGVFTGAVGRSVINSILVTTITIVLGLLINAMAAFALSALRVRGRGVIFAIVVLAFMVPFDAVAIPLASLTREAGLENTYAALIVPGLGNGLAIFLLRQFFLGIPPELAEAARLDGASLWRIFRSIYLPVSGNALIGAGLILFIFQWQSYLWPLLVTSDPAMDVGAVAIARLFGQYGVDWGLLFAGASVLTVIPLVVVLVFQRYLVGSVAASSVKG